MLRDGKLSSNTFTYLLNLPLIQLLAKLNFPSRFCDVHGTCLSSVAAPFTSILCASSPHDGMGLATFKSVRIMTCVCYRRSSINDCISKCSAALKTTAQYSVSAVISSLALARALSLHRTPNSCLSFCACCPVFGIVHVHLDPGLSERNLPAKLPSQLTLALATIHLKDSSS